MRQVTPESRNWWVLTGNDFSGKTTVANALRERGFQVVPEAAMQVIEAEMAAGRGPDSFHADEAAFQYGIFYQKMRNEAEQQARHGSQTLTFLDRGLHETRAFLEYYGIPETAEARHLMQGAEYRGVFMLEQLPSSYFREDFAHTEGPEFLSAMGDLIWRSYAGAGYEPIKVPFMPVDERVDYILQNVERLTGLSSGQLTGR
jgi:predicted ATPase